MPTIEFDLTRATAKDLQPILAQLGKGKMAVLPKLLAVLAVSCPTEWGNPNEESTWSALPLNGELKQAYGILKQRMAAVDTKGIKATFDLSSLTAAQFDELVTQLQQGEPKKQAQIIAKYVTDCSIPGARDVDLLLELPYYTEFRPLVNLLAEAGKKELENFGKAFADF